jgi:hypothetical protein
METKKPKLTLWQKIYLSPIFWFCKILLGREFWGYTGEEIDVFLRSGGTTLRPPPPPKWGEDRRDAKLVKVFRYWD